MKTALVATPVLALFILIASIPIITIIALWVIYNSIREFKKK